jgi:hypothetical protein
MELKVVPLTYLEQMKLAADIVGPSMSQVWWNTAKVAASVREIDGRIVMKPKHPVHIRRIIEQIGQEGFQRATREFNNFVPDRDETMTVTVRPVETVELWDMSEYAGSFFDLPPWRGLALVAVSVRSFNGLDLDFPKAIPELYARVEMLGFQGMDMAVEAAVAERDRREEEAAKEPPKGN